MLDKFDTTEGLFIFTSTWPALSHLPVKLMEQWTQTYLWYHLFAYFMFIILLICMHICNLCIILLYLTYLVH